MRHKSRLESFCLDWLDNVLATAAKILLTEQRESKTNRAERHIEVERNERAI